MMLRHVDLVSCKFNADFNLDNGTPCSSVTKTVNLTMFSLCLIDHPLRWKLTQDDTTHYLSRVQTWLLILLWAWNWLFHCSYLHINSRIFLCSVFSIDVWKVSHSSFVTISKRAIVCRTCTTVYVFPINSLSLIQLHCGYAKPACLASTILWILPV